MCKTLTNNCLDCHTYKKTSSIIGWLSENSKSILQDVKWNISMVVSIAREIWEDYSDNKKVCDKINKFILWKTPKEIDDILSKHKSSYTVENKAFLQSVI